MIHGLSKFARRFPVPVVAFGGLAVLLFISCSKQPETPAPAAESATTTAATTPAAAPAELGSAPVDDAAATALAAELTQVVRKYAAEKQRAPKGFEEIVAAGYLPSMPVAPGGRKFVIDRSLHVTLQ